MIFAQAFHWLPWFAVLCLACSIVQALYSFLISRRTTRSVGKIVEVEKSKKRVIATIEYVTQKGKRCRIRIPSFFDMDEWRKGKTMVIRYQTKRPTTAILERSLRAGWGRAGALFGLGVLVGIVGMVVGR